VKLAVPLLAMLASLATAPAYAQGALNHFDAGQGNGPDTQALAFVRIPFGEQDRRREPVIGFGLFADCTGAALQASATQRLACDAEPIRSLEFSRELYDRDWLISFRGERRWVGIARLHPDGFASVREYGPILDGPGMTDTQADQ
jgi:hypothetical protein